VLDDLVDGVGMREPLEAGRRNPSPEALEVPRRFEHAVGDIRLERRGERDQQRERVGNLCVEPPAPRSRGPSSAFSSVPGASSKTP